MQLCRFTALPLPVPPSPRRDADTRGGHDVAAVVTLCTVAPFRECGALLSTVRALRSPAQICFTLRTRDVGRRLE
jgi:hypothetical protein